jgi:hypothetical protein
MTASVEAFEPCDPSVKTNMMNQQGAEVWFASVLLVLIFACVLFAFCFRKRTFARKAKALREEDIWDDNVSISWATRPYRDDPVTRNQTYNDMPPREIEMDGRKFQATKLYSTSSIQ